MKKQDVIEAITSLPMIIILIIGNIAVTVSYVAMMDTPHRYWFLLLNLPAIILIAIELYSCRLSKLAKKLDAAIEMKDSISSEKELRLSAIQALNVYLDNTPPWSDGFVPELAAKKQQELEEHIAEYNELGVRLSFVEEEISELERKLC